ncbi:hypothetical protein HYH03_018984 [Edaphochlamys debaryana]|uniref:CCHC-type domain-containing protein n=1 Tax=Edaphochlamys debaryana TaxID=47281 RepID=A0A836BNT7_9CHLO|nr:hypothetical protein HYH03_018984 [Edaphochlamys debaryana]|eukprot:KAG2482064.1 hypothetical protein HYH03_018984 [Edaphochlamys debaryana]
MTSVRLWGVLPANWKELLQQLQRRRALAVRMAGLGEQRPVELFATPGQQQTDQAQAAQPQVGQATQAPTTATGGLRAAFEGNAGLAALAAEVMTDPAMAAVTLAAGAVPGAARTAAAAGLPEAGNPPRRRRVTVSSLDAEDLTGSAVALPGWDQNSKGIFGAMSGAVEVAAQAQQTSAALPFMAPLNELVQADRIMKDKATYNIQAANKTAQLSAAASAAWDAAATAVDAPAQVTSLVQCVQSLKQQAETLAMQQRLSTLAEAGVGHAAAVKFARDAPEDFKLAAQISNWPVEFRVMAGGGGGSSGAAGASRGSGAASWGAAQSQQRGGGGGGGGGSSEGCYNCGKHGHRWQACRAYVHGTEAERTAIEKRCLAKSGGQGPQHA